MLFGLRQAFSRDGGNILAINPGKAGVRNIVADHSVDDHPDAAVAEQVLHEDLGAQMREGEAGPLDVAFDELGPEPMLDWRVVIPRGAEMDDMLDIRPPGCV